MSDLIIKPSGTSANFKVQNPSGTDKIVMNSSGTITTGTLGSGVTFPAGMILNVQSTTKTDTTSANPTSDFADITGMSVSITPKATSSKILIQYNLQIGADTQSDTNGQSVLIKLVRDSTDIGIGDSGTGGERATNETIRFLGEQKNSQANAIGLFLDSPTISDTSTAITYKVQWHKPYDYPSGSLIYLNRSFQRDSVADRGNTISTIVAMEVAG